MDAIRDAVANSKEPLHDGVKRIIRDVSSWDEATQIGESTVIISVGAIIGIVVGSLLLIIGLFVCCCWCCSCCCFANRRQPGMVIVPPSNPITIINNAPPNQGYSRLAENYGGELQSVSAPPPYVANYPDDPHGRK